MYATGAPINWVVYCMSTVLYRWYLREANSPLLLVASHTMFLSFSQPVFKPTLSCHSQMEKGSQTESFLTGFSKAGSSPWETARNFSALLTLWLGPFDATCSYPLLRIYADLLSFCCFWVSYFLLKGYCLQFCWKASAYYTLDQQSRHRHRKIDLRKPNSDLRHDLVQEKPAR